MSNPAWPGRIQKLFGPVLSGSSMCTSLLSGIFFDDTIQGAKQMKADHVKSFWSRNRALITGFAITFLLIDVITIMLNYLAIMNLELFIGGILGISQLVVGLMFIKKSWNFVFGTMALMKMTGGADSAVSGTSASAARICFTFRFFVFAFSQQTAYRDPVYSMQRPTGVTYGASWETNENADQHQVVQPPSPAAAEK